MWNRKFGRNGDHRKAMLRNMATSVILYGKVETTEAKAKDMRSVVDELITLGKKGDLAARRQAASYIRNVVADEKTEQTVLQKLFDEVAPKYKDRNGGYTRVIKTGVRRGDAAPMATIELVQNLLKMLTLRSGIFFISRDDRKKHRPTQHVAAISFSKQGSC